MRILRASTMRSGAVNRDILAYFVVQFRAYCHWVQNLQLCRKESGSRQAVPEDGKDILQVVI